MLAQIKINSRKFDGSIHKSWLCDLLEENETYWLFYGKFEHEINHTKLGIIRRGTISKEYYFKNKWFNIFLFFEPNGDFKFYYCNVNMPPNFVNNVLDYIDLDIDILVQKDFSYEILDEDEFEENSIKFGYSQNLINQTKQIVKELLLFIKHKKFPF